MACGVNTHGMLSGELVHAFHVVRVFVGKQNGVQLIRLHSGGLHLIPQPGGAEPGIHQQDGFPALTMVAFPPLPLPNTQNCIMRGI